MFPEALQARGPHRAVISATATTYGPPPAPAPTGRTQDIADAAAQVLHAVLADRMVEDLATLRRINRLVAQARSAGRADLLCDGDGTPYRPIQVMDVSPPPGAMGALAAQVFARRTDGLGWLTENDNWLLGASSAAAVTPSGGGNCSATCSSTSSTSPPASNSAAPPPSPP